MKNVNKTCRQFPVETVTFSCPGKLAQIIKLIATVAVYCV